MVEENEGDSKEVKPKTTSRTRRGTIPRPSAAATRKRKRSVRLRSLWPGRMIITAHTVPSRKRYEFPSYGSILLVEEEDVDGLLSRRRGTRPCCGATATEQKYFELA